MQNRTIAGFSSETYSHPTDVNNKYLVVLTKYGHAAAINKVPVDRSSTGAIWRGEGAATTPTL
jgi:hypothetical protein